jgi:hypothetical protein
MTAVIVGVLLAPAVGLFARLSGLDRDRAFYPTVLAVVASYYDLFAVMGATVSVLLIELAVTGLFLVAVVAGFRRSLWIVVAGLFAHGVFDYLHPLLYDNPGVPAFWPPFCAAYDVVAAAWLAVALRRKPVVA